MTTVAIITKNNKYGEVVAELARRLANKDCSVQIQKNIPKEAGGIIFFGLPDDYERNRLQRLNQKYLIVLLASYLTNKQKTILKTQPVYFLPNNYSEDARRLAEEIANSFLAKRPKVKKEISPPASPAGTAKNQSVSPYGSDVIEPHHPSHITHHTLPISSPIIEKTPHISINPALFKRLLIFLLPLIVLLFLFLYPYSLYKSTKSHLIESVEALRRADFTRAETESASAQKSLNNLFRVYSFLGPAAAKVSPKEDQAIRQLYALGGEAIDLVSISSELGLRAKSFLTKLLTYQSIAIEQESLFFSAKTSLLKDRLTQLNTNLAVFNSIDSKVAKSAQKTLNNYNKDIIKNTKLIKEVEPVISLLPNLLAASGRKKYLILFQNNMELRPTGGFIGSVGFLRFENGKMLKLQVEDVYSLDGQLEGKVDPPAPISKNLNESNWYLRDANWSPDFPTSSRQIEWFVNKEIQTRLDGIIAVDLLFAKQALEALGGIYVPDYNTQITADNLYLKTQETAQRDFFPGSTNKRDILGSLARSFLIELATRKELPAAKLLEGISASLNEKHILLYFKDQTLQNTFDSLGWTGRLLQPECNLSDQDTTCIPDYLMIVDANLGVNKVNYFIKRTSSLNIEFSNNRLIRRLRLDYKNESSSQDFPGGTYKNYLRILVPPNSILDRITVDGSQVNQDNIIQEPEGKYRSYGFLVKIPPSSEKTVIIEYSSPLKPISGSIYELLVQKQPGSENPALILNLKQNPGQVLKAINFKPLDNSKGLIYNTTLSTDKIFKVKIL
jgi:hypothetical protein